MEKKIVVCIGTDRAGNVRARLSLMLVDDEGRAQFEHYHSVSLAPGDDLAETRAAVETHLADSDSQRSGIPFAPWPAIPDAEWAKVEGMCQLLDAPPGDRLAMVASSRALKVG